MVTQLVWSCGHTQGLQLSLVLPCSTVVSKDFEDEEVRPQGPSGNRAGSILGLWSPWQPAGSPFGKEESYLCIRAYYLLNSVAKSRLRALLVCALVPSPVPDTH